MTTTLSSEDLNSYLSPHFRLREMVVTSHRTYDNTPGEIAIGKLTRLCQTLLEPIREMFGPLYVTSGFRCVEVNAAIGGATNSAHMFGRAADFVPLDGHLTTDVVAWVAYASGLPFDKVIDEYSSTSNWIHIQIAREEHDPRQAALVMRRGVYTPFVHGG